MKIKGIKSLLLTSLVIASSQTAAQEFIASSDSFNYARCTDNFAREQIQSIFGVVDKLVELYNGQSDVDVRMEKPVSAECYMSVGKEGSMLAGVQSISYYPDSDLFRCSVAGSCIGNRAGYDATGTLMGGGRMQFSINTNRTEDMVLACLSKEGITLGRCN